MSDIKVVCTSDKNVSLTFTWGDFTPFHLVDIEGIDQKLLVDFYQEKENLAKRKWELII